MAARARSPLDKRFFNWSCNRRPYFKTIANVFKTVAVILQSMYFCQNVVSCLARIWRFLNFIHANPPPPTDYGRQTARELNAGLIRSYCKVLSLLWLEFFRHHASELEVPTSRCPSSTCGISRRSHASLVINQIWRDAKKNTCSASIFRSSELNPFPSVFIV